MIGYRNALLILAAVLSSTFLLYVGIKEGTDLLGLGTALGIKDGAVIAGVYGRGYNKKVTQNGKPQ